MNTSIADSSGELSILIVEDEPLLVMMLEDMLDSLGHRVVASCATLEEAMETVSSGEFDAVLLDLNLRGKSGLPVARQLFSNSIPFAVASGYPSDAADEAILRDVPFLQKPYAFEGLEKVLDELKDRVVKAQAQK